MKKENQLTLRSNEITRTVLSAKPTAKKRDLCSPDKTLAKVIHFIRGFDGESDGFDCFSVDDVEWGV